jgi:hypothetical protein
MTQSGLIAMIIPGFFLAFGLLWSAIVFLSSRISGWATLARHFPASEPASGQSWDWTSARFGWFANYRNVLSVTISPTGLYMRPVLPFRIGHRPLLIPWRAISGGQRANLYFTQTYRVDVQVPGSGTGKQITFYGKGLTDALEAHVGGS